MTAKPMPWAILLCRFRDDDNDPARTRISDLYAQWEQEHGAAWMADNMLPQSATDTRTILQVYERFFTPSGAGTFNAVRYWDEMSHGAIDVGGTRVFPCVLDLSSARGAELAQDPGGAAYQEDIFQRAKEAAIQQHGVNFDDYYGVAVSFQSPDYGAQGGRYDGKPGVYMDVRFVVGNGIQSWGQEMGHAFGLDHSRMQGSDEDYLDFWDIMSTRKSYSTPDPDYGWRGPGLNAWNMRCRQWLDESRIWKSASSADFTNAVALRPLHDRQLRVTSGLKCPASPETPTISWSFASPAPGTLGWEVPPSSCIASLDPSASS